jgi:hypothetical protein
MLVAMMLTSPTPSLAAASDEQYESILDDKIALLAMKFWAMHKF